LQNAHLAGPNGLATFPGNREICAPSKGQARHPCRVLTAPALAPVLTGKRAHKKSRNFVDQLIRCVARALFWL
jgi:hypothetical protein